MRGNVVINCVYGQDAGVLNLKIGGTSS